MSARAESQAPAAPAADRARLASDVEVATGYVRALAHLVRDQDAEYLRARGPDEHRWLRHVLVETLDAEVDTLERSVRRLLTALHLGPVFSRRGTQRAAGTTGAAGPAAPRGGG